MAHSPNRHKLFVENEDVLSNDIDDKKNSITFGNHDLRKYSGDWSTGSQNLCDTNNNDATLFNNLWNQNNTNMSNYNGSSSNELNLESSYGLMDQLEKSKNPLFVDSLNQFSDFKTSTVPSFDDHRLFPPYISPKKHQSLPMPDLNLGDKFYSRATKSLDFGNGIKANFLPNNFFQIPPDPNFTQLEENYADNNWKEDKNLDDNRPNEASFFLTSNKWPSQSKETNNNFNINNVNQGNYQNLINMCKNKYNENEFHEQKYNPKLIQNLDGNIPNFLNNTTYLNTAPREIKQNMLNDFCQQDILLNSLKQQQMLLSTAKQSTYRGDPFIPNTSQDLASLPDSALRFPGHQFPHYRPIVGGGMASMNGQPPASLIPLHEHQFTHPGHHMSPHGPSGNHRHNHGSYGHHHHPGKRGSHNIFGTYSHLQGGNNNPLGAMTPLSPTLLSSINILLAGLGNNSAATGQINEIDKIMASLSSPSSNNNNPVPPLDQKTILFLLAKYPALKAKLEPLATHQLASGDANIGLHGIGQPKMKQNPQADTIPPFSGQNVGSEAATKMVVSLGCDYDLCSKAQQFSGNYGIVDSPITSTMHSQSDTTTEWSPFEKDGQPISPLLLAATKDLLANRGAKLMSITHDLEHGPEISPVSPINNVSTETVKDSQSQPTKNFFDFPTPNLIVSDFSSHNFKSLLKDNSSGSCSVTREDSGICLSAGINSNSSAIENTHPVITKFGSVDEMCEEQLGQYVSPTSPPKLSSTSSPKLSSAEDKAKTNIHLTTTIEHKENSKLGSSEDSSNYLMRELMHNLDNPSFSSKGCDDPTAGHDPAKDASSLPNTAQSLVQQQQLLVINALINNLSSSLNSNGNHQSQRIIALLNDFATMQMGKFSNSNNNILSLLTAVITGTSVNAIQKSLTVNSPPSDANLTKNITELLGMLTFQPTDLSHNQSNSTEHHVNNFRYPSHSGINLSPTSHYSTGNENSTETSPSSLPGLGDSTKYDPSNKFLYSSPGNETDKGFYAENEDINDIGKLLIALASTEGNGGRNNGVAAKYPGYNHNNFPQTSPSAMSVGCTRVPLPSSKQQASVNLTQLSETDRLVALMYPNCSGLPSAVADESGIEKFSRKVFVGGLPPDIDEDEICNSFRHFGQLSVDWPHKAESKSFFPPKGYAFLLFQNESSVQTLVEACYMENGKHYLYVSSPTIKDKPVQIRAWNLNDADFVLDSSQTLDPRKTIFVGGVPRPLRALELALIMDRLYGNVCYAGIDTDPELKYPKGAGRVAFATKKSYVAAISARFVQLQHGDIDKRVEVKPYVLDDQSCDECGGIRCMGKIAPFFCANVACLKYYCEHCWAVLHSVPGREFHKPLVKEGGDRPRMLPYRIC